MKINKKELEELIFQSVDQINSMLPNDSHLTKQIESVLIGGGGVYDSLSILNFLVTLEEKLVNKYGKEIVLIDEEILADQEGPYKNLESLMERILELTADL